MEPDTFAGLDISRYRLVLRAAEPASLPAFLGSTLRGAFGHALKDAVCVMPHRNCERCMVMDRCLYPYLFETAPPEHASQLRGQQQAPHPFILTPEVAQTVSLRPLATPIPADVAQAASLSPSQVTAEAAPDVALAGPCDGSRLRGNGAAGPSTQGLANHTSSSVTGAAVAASLSPASPPRLVKQVAQTVSLRPGVSLSPPPPLSLSPVAPSERRIFLRPGDPISFGLVLLGRAIDYMPYVVFAVSEMARRGLGVNRTRFELDQVTMLGLTAERQIYSGRTQRISTPPDARVSLAELIRARLESSFPAPRSALRIASPLAELGCGPSELPTPRSALRIAFLTPTRIRIDGDAQFSLSFDLLIRSLLRRVSMLAAVHGRGALDLDYRGLIERAAQVRMRQSSLRWWDFERYSNRQGCKMKLGGFVGEIEYEGEAISEFLPLIAAGEILHVGSNTTFGLGLYTRS